MSKTKKPLVIALTGTPGTGKSRTAGLLERHGFAIINLNAEIKKRKLYSCYDRKRKTYVADLKKVGRFLINELKSERYDNKSVMIDSHLSHLLSPRLIDAVVVLRCEPAELEKRLKKRKWGAEKIRENVESEIIGLIEYEARKKHKKVFAIDTTKLNPEQVAGKIMNVLRKSVL